MSGTVSDLGPTSRGAAALAASDRPITIQLDLRHRTGTSPASSTLRLPTSNIGVVIVDTWNFHWCLTAAQRTASFVPRINQALTGVRRLGIQVFWAPTDVAEHYAGTVWRERAAAIALRSLPPSSSVSIPRSRVHGNQPGNCLCGPGLACQTNFGWDAMHPDLRIGTQDLIVDGPEELYSWTQHLGLTHLLYMGFATNMCVAHKDIGLEAMLNAGVQVLLARDMTDAMTRYDPDSGYTPDRGTQDVILELETLVPTINLSEELRKLGHWPHDWSSDPIRFTPWGTSTRPYIFEKQVITSLSAPFQPQANIHYTLDGQEPGVHSDLYETPLVLDRTTRIRAIALASGRPVGASSEAEFVRQPDEPPTPHLHCSDLTAIRATVRAYNRYYAAGKTGPARDRSYAGNPLQLRGTAYHKGIGVEAPSSLSFEVKQEYTHLVGMAGVDESLLSDALGGGKARYPGIVFRIIVDGRTLAESPLMRLGQVPWPFNVELPGASRVVVLAAIPSADSRYNLANWVNTGFLCQ